MTLWAYTKYWCVQFSFSFSLFVTTSLMTHSKGNLKSIGNKHLLFSNLSVWKMCQRDLRLSRLFCTLPVTIFQLTGYTKIRDHILTSLITESLGHPHLPVVYPVLTDEEMMTESQWYNCFIRNWGNAIPEQAGPQAKGSNPTTGLTLLWAHNPFRGNFNHRQVSREEAGQTWDQKESTSGPTPWQIYDDDDDILCRRNDERGVSKKSPIT